MPSPDRSPFVVGFGGTLGPISSSRGVLACVLENCEEKGAETRMFSGEDLNLPLYNPANSDRTAQASALVDSIRKADAIVISSPGYHGAISGLVKNAIDYVEDTSGDERPYFDQRPVGVIAVAAGWQATTSTMQSMRSIVHALRGWPTPLGIAVNSMECNFTEHCRTVEDKAVIRQCALMAEQLIGFACNRIAE